MATGEVDVLVQMWLSRWDQIRHSESQRATATNMLLVLNAAGIGFIVQKGLIAGMLIVTIGILILGAFGALLSIKYYERFRLHLNEANAIRSRLDELIPSGSVRNLFEDAWSKQVAEHPRIHKVPLHRLWLALHTGVSITGASLTAVILARL
ncbi:hypothetical protein [Pseudosporangium ferrugineum]|uniref:hypothetical protein n=1 Tax=Pseudosporangium ferrugineum TaxID=439699 RepID=UPI0011B1F429|nr:hypothetical protein [Pseudosporangium ferrugineum]